jgi:capsular polysaccharide transport system permease protein
MALELTQGSRSSDQISRLESYLHVIHALMLRDMRTRFGGTLWGYSIVVLWPCIHIFMLIGIYTFQHIPVPIGNSAPLFFATGAVPVLIFQYISREVMKAVMLNRPLTYYPQVKLFDLILARVLVEIVTGFLGLIVVMSLLLALGVDPRPTDSFVAVTGYMAAILLGIGIGVINVAILGFFPGWLIGYALFNIVMYLASGIIFMPSFLPEKIYYWMKFNPALQIAEWMRSAYFPSAGLRIDYIYVIMFALTSLSLGLFFVKHVVSRQS